jgi:hypothetical protein
VNPTGRDIAVVGAGVAGLTAARHLQAAGHHVQVFDKSRSTGGRLCTRRGDGWQGDHGAQYFTARHPDFAAELQRWSDAGAIALWQPHLVVLGGEAGHHLDPTVQRYVGTPRMGAPAKLLADGVAVQTQATVCALQRHEARWQVHTTEQGPWPALFDSVVLAQPAAQAATLLSTAQSPLASLARSVMMRGCWALLLRFEQPIVCGFDAAFVNSGPLGWVARDTSKPGRCGHETWIAQATPAWSEAHIEATPDAALAELLPAFTAWTGATPAASSAHRWRYADCAAPATVGCVWSAQEQLGLCGDWLNGGRVEGAWLSGRQLAIQLLTG